MSKVYAFLADGLEEVELLSTVDVLRRAGVTVDMTAIGVNLQVTGSHGITITADSLFADHDFADADLLFLPGGMPGTKNLYAHEGLCSLLTEKVADGQTRIAAICAAPMVLGRLGILEGKTATCYPGWEGDLKGARHTHQGVVTDGLVTTGRGMGYGVDMGLELAALLVSREASEQIRASIQYPD